MLLNTQTIWTSSILRKVDSLTWCAPCDVITGSSLKNRKCCWKMLYFSKILVAVPHAAIFIYAAVSHAAQQSAAVYL